jgi:uncharacterized protein (UPF0212 family)
MKFSANIILEVNEFEADSEEHAERIVNAYIDSLAKTANLSLTWDECDYNISESVSA